MSKYDCFGELYDQRPKLRIASRLSQSKTALELARFAQERNFNVSFESGGMRQDVYLNYHTEREEAFTVNKALRYLQSRFPDL